MPTANRIDNSRIVRLLNSAPMNTISADMNTSSSIVLSLLWKGCQVIQRSSYHNSRRICPVNDQGACLLPDCLAAKSAVAVNRVIARHGQRQPSRAVGQTRDLSTARAGPRASDDLVGWVTFQRGAAIGASTVTSRNTPRHISRTQRTRVTT